jgi:hypothetical protein
MSKWLAAVKSACFLIRRVSTYESERKKQSLKECDGVQKQEHGARFSNRPDIHQRHRSAIPFDALMLAVVFHWRV